MKILILGASGFIGEAVFQRLVGKYEVVIASRSQKSLYPNWRQVDFSKDNDWVGLTKDIDLIINAIGIISGDFTQVQTTAPMALFTHCEEQGIKIINISAIGAESKDPPNPFLKTKKKVDAFLLLNPLAKVIYPGIVLGAKGKSSRFFKAITEFSVVPLIGGDPPLVHISQLVELIDNIIRNFDEFPNQIFAIAQAETMADLYTSLRGKKAIYIKMPSWPMRIVFTIFPKLSIGIFNKNMVSMIDEIDVKNYQPIFNKKATSFVVSHQVEASDDFARAFGFVVLFMVWFWSGVSSLVSWSESESLMASIGIAPEQAAPYIYFGSIVDILLAFGLFLRKHLKRVLLLQIGFILIYTIILSLFAPEYWMHPFGVLIKNLPIVVLAWWLMKGR